MSWKESIQRKTLEHLDVIADDRRKCRLEHAFVEMLKQDRIKLAMTIPFFQGSIVEFHSDNDDSNLYSEDGSFKYDPHSF